MVADAKLVHDIRIPAAITSLTHARGLHVPNS
jgi:hypothetical protein